MAPPRRLPLAGPDDQVPGWYAIASSRELRNDAPLALQRFGQRWVAFRHATGVSVLFDRCPHRGVALSLGSVKGDRLVCPFHGFEYDPTGRCRLIPAHGPDGTVPKAMRVEGLPAREAHGFVFAWWGPVPDELPAIDWFGPELEGCVGPYETWRDSDVGLSRNIENQLDMAHLPFIHRNTIGRFAGGPEVDVETVVDGQRIRAFRRGGGENYIELRLPNIWLNHIGQHQRIVLAFAPIDATHTRLYVHFYQSRLTVPILRDVVGWIMTKANERILGEDLAVIHSHDTAVSPELDGTEVLVPSDGPIIAYRKLRKQQTEELSPALEPDSDSRSTE